MTFDNDEEERKYATESVFVNIQDRGFQQILQLRCRHEIAEAAPPEAIDAVLDMESIPTLWAQMKRHLRDVFFPPPYTRFLQEIPPASPVAE